MPLFVSSLLVVIHFFRPFTLNDSFETIMKSENRLANSPFASLHRTPPPGKDDAPAMLIVKEAFPEITTVQLCSSSIPYKSTSIKKVKS